ncbi:hypothetical protein LEMLEM_LOCUS15263 [Lemmus lemmus]
MNLRQGVCRSLCPDQTQSCYTKHCSEGRSRLRLSHSSEKS